MATEETKYVPSRTEDALDWGKLVLKGLVAVGTIFTAALTIKHTINEATLKTNDPDKYWDKVNKRGCNSAHVIADAINNVADAIRK